MRTTVALVAARPDTIEEDYARLLDLAGLTRLGGAAKTAALVGGRDRAFVLGWDAPPWQLDGVLGALDGPADRIEVAAVGPRGIGPVSGGRVWSEILAARGARGADADWLRTHRPASQLLHPALDAVLPGGVRLPVGLAGTPTLLLAVPTLQPGWGVAGAAGLLRNLVTGGADPGRRAPGAEVTAEAVGVAAEHLGDLGAILDGSLWGIAEGWAGRRCVARNVLLAGRDPVAVDAVAARLAGLDPMRVPWLRICHDRGFGRVLAAEIRLAGATGLADLDFDLPGSTFAAGRETPGGLRGGPLGRLGDRLLGRGGHGSLSGTPWQNLHDAYLAGAGPTSRQQGH